MVDLKALEQLETSMPDLHSASVSESELFQNEEACELDNRLKIFIDKAETIEALETLKPHLTSNVEGLYYEKLKSLDPSKTDYSNYVFRASSFGKLMTGVPKPFTESQKATFEAYDKRYKGDGKPLTPAQLETYGDLQKKKHARIHLSQGAKTYLEELVREDMFGRRKILHTKYTKKGVEVEEQAATLYSEVSGQFLVTNKERKANEFWTGEADNVQGKIRDFKSSWEFSTFPIQEKEIPKTIYDWQLDVYMELYGLKEAELVYCLVDTPSRFVDDELKRLDWKYNILNFEGDVREEHIEFVVETVSNLIYTQEGLKKLCEESTILEYKWFGNFKEIPKHQRVKVFKKEYSARRIQQGKTMIKLARKYMNKIKASLI